MAKTFYTEYDIEDFVKRGVMSLEVNDDVVLTDLAYEKARRLGMALHQQKAENPPAAPVRPYIAKIQNLPQPSTAGSSVFSVSAPRSKPGGEELRQRIRAAVTSRMGTQVDPKLLEVIINRVLTDVGIK